MIFEWIMLVILALNYYTLPCNVSIGMIWACLGISVIGELIEVLGIMWVFRK